MSDEETVKPFSEMSSRELLDMAQACGIAAREYSATNVDQMVHIALGSMLAQAAQARATQETMETLEIVLEHRILPGITSAIWDGLR